MAAHLTSYHGPRPGEDGTQARGQDLDLPLPTQATSKQHALVAASMISMRGTNPEQIQGCSSSIEDPLKTVSAGGIHAAMVSALLVQSGYGEREGQAPRTLDIQAPLGTVVAQGVKHGLVAANMMAIDNQSGAGIAAADEPLTTVTSKARHALVAAFIQHYYGSGTQHQDPGQPLHTITATARHAMVTVEIDGETYVITDIGMRMLDPKELARAMGFPEDFKWTEKDGKRLTKRDQVKMIGNACPVNTVASLIKAVITQRGARYGLKEALSA